MKNLLVGALVLSAAVMFISPLAKAADGQGTQSPVDSGVQRVQATIPFQFRAGKAVLPAGTYVFSFDNVHQAGWIEGVDRHLKIVSLETYIQQGAEPRLEFQREGKMMVLRGAGETGRQRNRATGLAEMQHQEPASGR